MHGASCDRLCRCDGVMTAADDLPPGWTAVAFGEIDSTNAEAMRRAAAGERGPLYITATHQTGGRGRSGRTWTSAIDSLAATLLMAPGSPLAALPQLSLVAGIAAHQVISDALPTVSRAECRLKWPNDVLIGGAKVCGVLVESAVLGSDAVAAIGIGINVGATPQLADRTAAALAPHGAATGVAALRTALARSLARWLDVWAAGANFTSVRRSWLGRAGPLGELMTIHAGSETVIGRFAGLDPDGSLIIDDQSGTRRKFSFGDVALGVPSV